MAISSFKVFLMYKGTSGTAYNKLIDIIDFPDLGGAPELLDTTTLSDKMRTYINGIQSSDGLTFNANYTPEDYDAIIALDNTQTSFAVWFGGTEQTDGTVTPTGEYGKFVFTGEPSVYVTGAGVNEVVRMAITIAPSTVVQKVED